MIDGVSSQTIIPIQQRPAVNDGEQFQQQHSSKKCDSTAQTEKPKQVEKKKLEEVVKGLNDFLQPRHTSLKFKLYDKLNEYYCQVIDDNTKEVLAEIPPKKLLDVYAIMAEQLGFIIDKKI
jgi:flagellar protein FlaG